MATKSQCDAPRTPPKDFWARLSVDCFTACSAGAGIVFLSSVSGVTYNLDATKWLFGVFYVLAWTGFFSAVGPEQNRNHLPGFMTLFLLLTLLVAIPGSFVLTSNMFTPHYMQDAISFAKDWMNATSLGIMTLTYMGRRASRQLLEHLNESAS